MTKNSTRTLSCVVGLVLGVILLPASSGAATLPFTGALSVDWLENSQLPGKFVSPSYSIPGSGVSIVGRDASFQLLSMQIVGGTFGPANLSVPNTANAWRSVRFTSVQNLFGTFSGFSGSSGGGTMGLSGTDRICLIWGDCRARVGPYAYTPTGSPAVGFRIGGTWRNNTTSGSITWIVSLQHSPWTTGQPVLTIHQQNASVTTPTLPGGFAHGPASATSTAAQASGALQMVTATKVFAVDWGIAGGGEGTLYEFPIIGTLNLHFVPEPGTLVLLSSAAVALA